MERQSRGEPARRTGAALGERWETDAQAVFFGLREWRALHPKATLAEIESELDQRWAGLRAAMVSDLALASAATAVQAGARPTCASCGGPLQDEGAHERTLVTLGNATVRLRRAYAHCPACGSRFFPPRC